MSSARWIVNVKESMYYLILKKKKNKLLPPTSNVSIFENHIGLSSGSTALPVFFVTFHVILTAYLMYLLVVNMERSILSSLP